MMHYAIYTDDCPGTCLIQSLARQIQYRRNSLNLMLSTATAWHRHSHIMTCMLENIEIGTRICSDGNIGSVLFKGSVAGTKGDWLGVEWDDPGRGKHDGSHDGQQYFATSHPTSGSFIRLTRANFGVSLMEAATERYGMVADENAGVNTEDMFVLGKNQQTTVEVIGAQSVNLKQSKFDQLKAVVLRDTSVNSAGPDGKIATSMPLIQELDISKNLLSSWKEVARITCQLLKLVSLNVSENKLRFPSIPEEPQIRESFHDVLQVLYINRMNYTWEQVVACCGMMPNLRQLHACFNQINQLGNISEIVPKLTLLNLESKPISNWQQVLQLGALHNLQTLILNKTGLSSIEFPDVDGQHIQKTKFFPNLKSLSFSQNELSEMGSINELNKLRNLSEFKMRANPLLQTDECSLDTLRTLIIAKIAGLTLLNASTISPTERRGSELDYLKRNGKSWKEAGGNQDPSLSKPSVDFCKLHPRFQKLIDKYGPPEDYEMKVVSSALKNSLIVLSIDCPEVADKPVLKKKLPVTMTVQKLKVLLQRLYKVDAYAMKLTYTSAKMEGPEIGLEGDLKEIGYYSIEDGDSVHVKW